jgi:hypothetical protein
MSEAVFGAVVSSLFVAALWLNYHGFIPSTDTSQQKDKTEQTDRSSKDKSEQEDKSKKTEKSSPTKTSKKKASMCIKNCPDDWQLRQLSSWPKRERSE